MIPRIEEIEAEILSLQERRDRIAASSRNIIRLSGRCITMMHAGNVEKAKATLDEITALSKKLMSQDKGLEYASQQAYQEYVEACVLYFIITERRIPAEKELGVDSISYLLGLLDVVGELKREVFESLRKDEIEKAEAYYSFMNEIHDSLLPLRFSSSIIPDFRKKQDVSRIQLEGVRGELLSFRNRLILQAEKPNAK